MRVYLLLLFTAAALISGCGKAESGQAPVSETYHEEHKKWKQERIESLSDSAGWLRLAGMFWLEEGENSFGSREDNAITFPEGTIPAQAGTFLYENGQVVMTADDGVSITHEGEPVTEIILFDGEETPVVKYGSLEWFVIVRDDQKAIRLFNKDNPQADVFDGFPAYPVDPEWKRQARFFPAPEGTTVPIVSVVGQHIDAPSPGMVEFTIDGETFSLTALENSTRMFIIFADETNKTETYQAGRYIYIDYPDDESNYTVIDFNKAYNPPCSFNIFTTCQLPPQENRLDVSVTAGEQRPADWQGLDITPD
jgi:uncharacterized protein